MSWQQFFLNMTGGQKQKDRRRGLVGGKTKEQRRFIKAFTKHGVDEDDAEEILRNMGVIDQSGGRPVDGGTVSVEAGKKKKKKKD